MKSFIDDLAGAIFDILNLFCYFLAGGVIVSGAMFAIVGIANFITGN